MTRFLLRLMGVAALVCMGIVLLALQVGHGLPQENEIIFSAAVLPEDSNIYRMSVKRHIAAMLTHDPSKEWLASWSHDGQKIAFVSQSPTGSGIYLMDADELGTYPLVNDLYKIKSPVWSPDDRFIAYISDADYPQLRLLDLQTADVRSLTDSMYAPDEPTWAPDGTQIAFVSDTPLNENKDLYTVNVKSSKVSLLATINKFNMSPSWSPDGKQIYFVSYASENQQFYIYSVDVHSGALRLLITGAASPVASPDGRYLLYQNRDLSSLNLMDLSNTKTVLLYQDTLGALSTPDWSLDGQSIFYVLYRADSTHIYTLNVAECLRQADPCVAEQLTDKSIPDSPRWRPQPP